MKSAVEHYNSWLTGPGVKWTGKKSYQVEDEEKVEDGRDERLSAIGDGGQAAISLTSDVDGTHIHIFEGLQLESSHVGNSVKLLILTVT